MYPQNYFLWKNISPFLLWNVVLINESSFLVHFFLIWVGNFTNVKRVSMSCWDIKFCGLSFRPRLAIRSDYRECMAIKETKAPICWDAIVFE